MKKIILPILFFTLFAISTKAQDANDAILYGYQTYHGTARSMGLGNAVGSIGADIASTSSNPSGIGMYRSSQLNFTLAYNKNNTLSSYYTNSNTATKSKLNFSEIGLVISNNKRNQRSYNSKWKAVNFALSGNRVADFNTNIMYTGKNNKSSLIERFADDFNRAGGYNNTALANVNYSAYAAWSTYLIDKDFNGDTTKAKAYVPYTDGLQQTKTVTQSGGIMNYNATIAANYNEKLLVGATLGFDNLVYNSTFNWNEKDLSGRKDNFFDYVDYTETTKTNGSGINLKIGATLLASKNVRLGAAIHTPTHYEMTSEYKVSMETDTDSLLFGTGQSSKTAYTQDSVLVSQYGYNSPFKALASGTFMFNKLGFVSADIEYVDYAGMNYRFAPEYAKEQQLVNNDIKNKYQSTMNIRLGAEIKLGFTYLRGGYAMYGNPYKNISSPTNKYSLGLGYRGKDAFIDLAYVHTTRTVTETPYTIQRANADIQNATINNRLNVVALTLGVKF
jgi:hypothetical protein